MRSAGTVPAAMSEYSTTWHRRPDVGDLGGNGSDLVTQGLGGDLEGGPWIAELAAQPALDGADRRRHILGERSDQLGGRLHGDLRCERAAISGLRDPGPELEASRP